MTRDNPSSPAIATFLMAADRIEAILDQERGVLEALSGDALKVLSERKARSLLEISRAARSLGPEDGPKLRARLERLRDKLDQSRSALRLHLNAAHEIAGLVSRAIEEAESDGTYNVGMARRPKR